jgi:predicted nucleotidyltransferase
MHRPDQSGAQHSEALVRLRRTLVLRMMVASGASQREAAAAIGISQSAVSRQLQRAPALKSVRPDVLLNAAAPGLRSWAEEHGYCRLAVFGSLARGDARDDSDIDLLVDAPPGTSSFDFVRFQQLIETVIGRKVDLISYGGLRAGLDSDVRREAILL